MLSQTHKSSVSRTTNADKIIGKNIYNLRIQMGFSREQIAHKVGVTHQQFHKYEYGINRISAVRLHLLAKVFGVNLADFFDEDEDLQEIGSYKQLVLEMMHNFKKINLEHQRAINALVKSIIIYDKKEV